jgi:hypothetical protein
VGVWGGVETNPTITLAEGSRDPFDKLRASYGAPRALYVPLMRGEAAHEWGTGAFGAG